MSERIALLGSSCNPPGLHHRHIVQDLVENGFHVIVVPCGLRPDKKTVNDIDPLHRAVMTDMTFGDLDGVEIWLDDLEQDEFTRTYDLDRKFRARGEITHYVGTDLVRGGRNGSSAIQKEWYRGVELWKRLRFVVGTRPSYNIQPGDLPPNHELLKLSYEASSTNIRTRVFSREPFDRLVVPRVREYIERYGLYRGRVPSYSVSYAIDHPKPFVFFDKMSERARDTARGIKQYNLCKANCIIVVGGDGTMLHAISKHWRTRLPFFGINTGHLGFLLNNLDRLFSTTMLDDLEVYHLPLLFTEIIDVDGGHHEFFALNDAWLERSSKQTAWIRVMVDGKVKIHKLIADGALISTAAGSTAYANAMGATPLLLGTPEMLLVGSNVCQPKRWKVEPLGLSSHVSLRSLDPAKRPVRACVDSEVVENAVELSARVSRTASVELLQFSQLDMAKKRSALMMR